MATRNAGPDSVAPIVETACAKVNLDLTVLGRRPDGYHELHSLVAFAIDLHDVVTLTPGATADITLSGAFADALVGDNLIDKARRMALAQSPGLRSGSFAVHKQIPVAAGLGGGSADAAAALRALARLNRIPDPEVAYADLALAIGADVPVCLGGDGRTAAVMSGVGERLARPLNTRLLPDDGVFAVLLNPRLPVATGEVFRRLAAPPLSAPPAAPLVPDGIADFDTLIDHLQTTGNDLQAPALDLAPAIADVLDVLAGLADCRLARMSGSGATCFGLFATRTAARAAHAAVEASHPAWWAAMSRLG